MKKMLLLVFMQLLFGWTTAQIYHVGDLYTAEDGSKGIVFYVFPDGSGWAVALQNLPDKPWIPPPYADIPNLPNLNGEYPQTLLADTAGYSNTQIIREFVGAGAQCAANAVDFENGWYLPAIGQLCILYAQLPLIEQSLLSAGGSSLVGIDYFSSSESDYAVWAVNFSNDLPPTNDGYSSIDSQSGKIQTVTKTLPFLARAIRTIPAPVNHYDTTLTYLWNTGDTEPHFQVTPEQTTDYSVTVTNAYGCSNTASTSVTVIDGSPQTVYDTICQGTAYNNYGFTLTENQTIGIADTSCTRTVAINSCESELTLQLTLRSADFVSYTQHACENFVWNGISYSEEGTYTQSLSNRFGCDSIVEMQLFLGDTSVSILLSGDFCDQFSAELFASEGMDDYLWSTGEQTPQIVVSAPGTYRVTASVDGCDATAQITIAPCELIIYLPNAITPSLSDGLNDAFCLPDAYKPLLNDFEISIFNRWGEMVFYSTDKDFRWKGEVKGKIFYNNVYNYLIRYTGLNGKPEVLIGTITVL